MHSLGHTRSSQQPNHLLLTPDTFVRTVFPGMKGCVAVVHVGPALGAKFTQYTGVRSWRRTRSTPRSVSFCYGGIRQLDALGKHSDLARLFTPICRKVSPIE